MAVCAYEQQLEYIKKKIEKKSYYPFLSQNIIPPKIDEDRIMLLAFSLENSSLSKDERENYITSAMLAHFAMIIHEYVSGNKPIPMKEKQLGILAGDYYSGLYYHLLASHHKIDLIKILADAIKKVNEKKIYIYQHQQKKLEDFMMSVKEIETSLIVSFSNYFNKSHLVSQFIAEFLFLRRLLLEINHLETETESLYTMGIRYCMDVEASNQIETSVQYAKNSRLKLDDMMRSIPTLPSYLEKRLENLTKQLERLSSL